MPSNAELSTALAFVLNKWKEAGASRADTEPFEALLSQKDDEPPSSAPAEAIYGSGHVKDVPQRETFTDYTGKPSDDPNDPDWCVGTGYHNGKLGRG